MIASHKIAWWRLCKRISVKNKTKQNKNPTKLQTCWQRIEFLLLMFNRRLHWEIFYVSKKLFIKYPFSEFKKIWSQSFIPVQQESTIDSLVFVFYGKNMFYLLEFKGHQVRHLWADGWVIENAWQVEANWNQKENSVHAQQGAQQRALGPSGDDPKPSRSCGCCSWGREKWSCSWNGSLYMECWSWKRL